MRHSRLQSTAISSLRKRQAGDTLSLRHKACGFLRRFAGLHRGTHPQQKGAEPLRAARKGDRADKQIPLVVGRAERQDIRAFGRAF